MDNILKYSGASFAIGLILVFVGPETGIDILSMLSMILLIVGGVGIAYVYLRDYQKYYCASCGQYLGRGEPGGTCPRCGSNRYTTSDPGAKR